MSREAGKKRARLTRTERRSCQQRSRQKRFQPKSYIHERVLRHAKGSQKIALNRPPILHDRLHQPNIGLVRRMQRAIAVNVTRSFERWIEYRAMPGVERMGERQIRLNPLEAVTRKRQRWNEARRHR